MQRTHTTRGTAHPTKKGPGRHHKEGQSHGAAPVPAKGGYFLGQHTNPLKNERRAAIKAAGGIRQFKRATS